MELSKKPRAPRAVGNLCKSLAFLSLTAGSAHGLTIQEADFNAVPVGESILLTGEGFTGTTAATFLWSGQNTETTFTEISDTELEVEYSAFQAIRDHTLIVEAENGSSVTFGGSESEVSYFTETGTFTAFPPFQNQALVVRAGAVLEGVEAFGLSLIYVEAGGSMSHIPTNTYIFAEDGAVLDFRNFPALNGRNTFVYYSPNTQILGEVPNGNSSPFPGGFGSPYAKQVTPLSLSTGVGPFTRGFSLDVNVFGDGQVERDLPGPYYDRTERVTLTAIPLENQFFTGWSGGFTSNETTITVGPQIQSITASFSAGRLLEIYSGSGGSVTQEPDLAIYPDDSTVTLTATAAEGFEFIGWGGEAVGSTASVDVFMDADKQVVPIFRPLAQPSFPQIAEADTFFVPEGESFTFTGSGFTETTRATFFWNGQSADAPFNEISDDTLEVTYQAQQSIREHSLLLETSSGSLVTTSTLAENVLEFSSVGRFEDFNTFGSDFLIVKPGAVLEGISSFNLNIYVEAGAVLKWSNDSNFNGYIFAEDGAVLDFREGFPSSGIRSSSVFYSPQTLVLGAIPELPSFPFNMAGDTQAARQVSSLSLSFGIGPFTVGSALEVTIVGDGTVVRDKPGPFYPRSEEVTFTATPGEGQFFTGWSGGSTLSESTITVRAGVASLTATFSAGRSLEVYTGLGGTVSQEPDLPVYPDQTVVTLTATPSDGFEFIGWGGEVSGEEDSLDVLIEADKQVVAIFRSLTQENLPQIQEVDTVVAPVGEPITLTGSGFTGTTRATFLWNGLNAETETNELSDSSLEVLYAAVQPIREHSLLVETPQGSVITTESLADEVAQFSTVGNYEDNNPFNSATLVVKAGAILEGVSSFSLNTIYVEAGGVLKWSNNGFFNGNIFAENGATLDFQDGFPSIGFRSTTVFYSPQTLILGEIPERPSFPFNSPVENLAARELTPITLSYGIGSFTAGFSVEVIVEGPGRVEGVEALSGYLTRGDLVSLTAIPDEGNHFVRWTGGSSSSDPELNLSARSNLILTAKFSSRVDFLSEWRLRFFSPEQLADPEIAGLSANPDGDALTNTAEYAFGSNPLVADDNSEFQITAVDRENQTIEISYQRPSFSGDLDYFYLGTPDLINYSDLRENEEVVVEEFEIQELDGDFEKVSVRFSFANELAKSYSFQISAELR